MKVQNSLMRLLSCAALAATLAGSAMADFGGPHGPGPGEGPHGPGPGQWQGPHGPGGPGEWHGPGPGQWQGPHGPGGPGEWHGPGPGFGPGPGYNQIDPRKAGELVTLLYQAILFRTPDPSGMNTWANLIQSQGVNGLIQAARGIASSPEFCDNILRNYRAEDIVENIYRVFFRRDADPSGLNTYSNSIRQGQAGEALAAMVGSDEFRQDNLY